MTTPSNNGAALITGGARGIGASIVRRFARDGLPVAIFDLDDDAGTLLAQEIVHAGGRALALPVDITDTDAVQTAVERVANELAPPLITVNNAGLTRDELLFRMSLADW